jgi:hypothetical protein
MFVCKRILCNANAIAGKPRSHSTRCTGFSREEASASDACVALATQPSRLKPVPRE